MQRNEKKIIFLEKRCKSIKIKTFLPPFKVKNRVFFIRLVYFITLVAVSGMPVMAQNYPAGHRSMTFYDVSRNNRPVLTKIYYPATTPGESTPTAAGVFPADGLPGLRVCPNPSGDLVCLSGACTGKEPIFAEISDRSGRRSFSCLISPQRNRYRVVIDMKPRAGGIYVASIRTARETCVIKIVKN